MQTKVSQVEHNDAVAKIINELPPNTKLIRLDGFMGVGKSCLGRQLAEQLNAVIVDSDDFVVPSDQERGYADCLRLQDLRTSVNQHLDRGDTVVLAAVCSREVLPPSDGVAEFTVYLKRLSFSTPDWPHWHRDPDVEETPVRALEKSIHEYHLNFRPHLTSALILEIPEEGHSLTGQLPI